MISAGYIKRKDGIGYIKRARENYYVS